MNNHRTIRLIVRTANSSGGDAMDLYQIACTTTPPICSVSKNELTHLPPTHTKQNGATCPMESDHGSWPPTPPAAGASTPVLPHEMWHTESS